MAHPRAPGLRLAPFGPLVDRQRTPSASASARPRHPDRSAEHCSASFVPAPPAWPLASPACTTWLSPTLDFPLTPSSPGHLPPAPGARLWRSPAAAPTRRIILGVHPRPSQNHPPPPAFATPSDKKLASPCPPLHVWPQPVSHRDMKALRHIWTGIVGTMAGAALAVLIQVVGATLRPFRHSFGGNGDNLAFHV